MTDDIQEPGSNEPRLRELLDQLTQHVRVSCEGMPWVVRALVARRHSDGYVLVLVKNEGHSADVDDEVVGLELECERKLPGLGLAVMAYPQELASVMWSIFDRSGTFEVYSRDVG